VTRLTLRGLAGLVIGGVVLDRSSGRHVDDTVVDATTGLTPVAFSDAGGSAASPGQRREPGGRTRRIRSSPAVG